MSNKSVISSADKKALNKSINQILKDFKFFRVSKMGRWKDNILKIGIQPGDLKTPTFDNEFAQSRYVNLADKIRGLSNIKKCDRILFVQGMHRMAGLEIIVKNKKPTNPKKNVVSKRKIK